MPPEQIIAWIVAANTAITLATSLYTFLTSRASKAIAAIEKLSAACEQDREKRKIADEAVVARFSLLEQRVLKTEAAIEHLPDVQASHRLELAIATLNGRIETLDEKLKPVAAIADRMQELLLEQAKR
jgi:hypothetical protein